MPWTRNRSILGVTRRLPVALTGRFRVDDGPALLQITSNGGGSSASISVANGSTAVTTVTTVGGTAPIAYSKSGTDAGDFNINSSTGALTFASPADHGNPTDADTNNVYLVTVTATDDDMTTASQDLTITVLSSPVQLPSSVIGGAAYSETTFAG